jgi:hypothetical protein
VREATEEEREECEREAHHGASRRITALGGERRAASVF